MKGTYGAKVLVFLFAVILLSCQTSKVKQKPNIVWITSEDNSVHYMKMYDINGVETPNIESLAADGLIFSNAFSNAAVCSAARSTIISGCYGPRIASHYHRKQELVPMPDRLEMFPAYLKQAGYYTANCYKEDYNIFKSDTVWDDSSPKATWRDRKEGQPFFYVFNIATTHESRLHFDEEVYKTHKTNFKPSDVKVQPNHPNTDLFKYTGAYYRDKVSQMDLEVGAVVAELKKEGLLDNTFIFYYGDHGGVLPGSKGYIYETGLHVPLVVYIPDNYKKILNGFERGSKVDGFVSFVDFAPTVLNLAGISLPKGLDGKPFLGGCISKNDVNKRNITYSYADRFDEKYDMVRAIRKGNYKYIRNYQPFNYDGLMNVYRYKQLAYQEWKDLYSKDSLTKVQEAFFKGREAEMLFDVERDTFEIKNLANDPEFKSVLADMRQELNKMEAELPDLSFYPEFYLKNNAFGNPAKFGKENRQNILTYKAVSDLALLPYDEAKVSIKSALESNDAWKRYWALIVCSYFNHQAVEFIPIIKKISLNDKELINKVRAAEFLGILGIENPSEVMLEALYQSQDNTETLLILNSIVLMKDINYGYDITVDESRVKPEILKGKETTQRFEYLRSL